MCSGVPTAAPVRRIVSNPSSAAVDRCGALRVRAVLFLVSRTVRDRAVALPFPVSAVKLGRVFWVWSLSWLEALVGWGLLGVVFCPQAVSSAQVRVAVATAVAGLRMGPPGAGVMLGSGSRLLGLLTHRIGGLIINAAHRRFLHVSVDVFGLLLTTRCG